MPQVSDEDMAAGRSCADAVNDAFKLSLRWMAIMTDRLPGGKVQVLRFGPFGSDDEAELYANNVANDNDTKIEIVEMYDIRVHEERMLRWHQEMDEKRKLARAYKDAEG